MKSHAGVGFLIFLLCAAVGMYLVCASDERLERTPWWIFW
jgi:hypothetical protein